MAEITNVETPVVETPVVATSVDTPKPISLKDDDLVPFTIDGKEESRPWKEVRGHIMRTEDYTRKTQGVSKQAQELKDLYDALVEKDKQVTERTAAIDAILGRATPKQDKVELADDEVITAKQLREALAHATSQVVAQANQTSEQAVAMSRFERWNGLVEDTIGNLTKEHSLLTTIPDLDVVLKRQASKSNPGSEREMLEAILKSGKKLAEDLEAKFTERSKEVAKKQADLRAKGPEPVNKGTPQYTTPNKSFMRGKGNRKIDWDAIDEAAIEAVNQSE